MKFPIFSSEKKNRYVTWASFRNDFDPDITTCQKDNILRYLLAASKYRHAPHSTKA